MKKVGIVTFHRANNYGVCLQAYATAAFLNENGYYAEIIDYTNKYEQRIQKWSYKENNKITGYLTSLLKNVLLGKKYYFGKAFGNVIQNYPLSEKRYTSPEQLNDVKYDILVAGSDQIWNPTITNGIDEVFLLQFGQADRRISIASSLGSTALNDEDSKRLLNALKNFSAVSVREEFAQKLLQPLTEKKVKILMDPTFLLDKQEWIQRMGCKSKYHGLNTKYILTYFVAPNKQEYQERVRKIADKLNLPVWTIQYSNYTWNVSSKKILGATLNDFIALIENAELVLTDSFHGTAFSVNLESNFIAFKHKNNPVRVMGLLSNLGLDDRLDLLPENYHIIDYKQVKPKLDSLRDDSKAWILDSLEGR